MAGHVFLVNGDITKLYCDSWLLPGDRKLQPRSQWSAENECLRDRLEKKALSKIDQYPRVFEFTDWSRDAGPKPWLVDMGGNQETKFDWYIKGVKEFFICLNAGIAKERFIVNRAKPLVALPLVGTGGGGAGNFAGDILDKLIPVLYEQARSFDLDVALVLNAPAAYTAAVNARKRFNSNMGPIQLNDSLKEKARALAERAIKGELVLFIGAGVSAGAGLPIWRKLLLELAAKAELLLPGSDSDDETRKSFEGLNNRYEERDYEVDKCSSLLLLKSRCLGCLTCKRSRNHQL